VDYLQIEPNQKPKGKVRISGAKNAALPLLACTILSKNKISIKNLPDVTDINTMLKLLGILGATYSKKPHHIDIDSSTINSTKATYDIVKTMRASILTLGPLLSRFNHCEVSLPGGCAIGSRPVDIHLSALEQMGADIDIKDGYIYATTKDGLKGATIIFDKITVTGSENIIMAACLAYGKSTLINVAKEPEVVQLCEVLQTAGVDIEGIGTDRLTIIGTQQKLLNMKAFEVIPDRIEAGTYLCVGAITNTKMTVTNINASHLEAVLRKFGEMGFGIEIEENSITIYPTKEVLPVHITTTEYPGFPTDMQAQFMAVATQADGTSVIDERLFENRYMHVAELNRMGANIKVVGSVATIENAPHKLTGTKVMATDLRASSCLILCALVASSPTTIDRIYHLDRGYEKLEEKFKKINITIKRKKIDTK